MITRLAADSRSNRRDSDGSPPMWCTGTRPSTSLGGFSRLDGLIDAVYFADRMVPPPSCGTIPDMPDCLFCRIVAGEVPGEIVLASDELVAFLDARPVFKGHVLLVPREHVETLPDLPATLRDPFLAAAQRLATAMQDGLGSQGSFVAMNNTVSQSVPHLHCHVVPRTKGDGLRGFFWPRTKYADGEAATYAERLRAVLDG